MGVELTQKMKICLYSCDKQYLYLLFYLRMALNKSLNTTCDLERYLFCRMPKWGKFNLFQDTYTRTEKYCAWERAHRKSSVRIRRRTLHREVRGSHEENSATSETDVPVGQGL